jgi:hypothetical protein
VGLSKTFLILDKDSVSKPFFGDCLDGVSLLDVLDNADRENLTQLLSKPCDSSFSVQVTLIRGRDPLHVSMVLVDTGCDFPRYLAGMRSIDKSELMSTTAPEQDLEEDSGGPLDQFPLYGIVPSCGDVRSSVRSGEVPFTIPNRIKTEETITTFVLSEGSPSCSRAGSPHATIDVRTSALLARAPSGAFCDQEVQAQPIQSTEAAVNTDISHDVLGFTCKACTRPPLMPKGHGDDLLRVPAGAISLPRERGQRRSTRTVGGTGVQFGCVSEELRKMHGNWVCREAVVSDWLRYLTIDAFARQVIDGTSTVVELKFDNSAIILEGGIMYIDGDLLRRVGKSGVAIEFDRAAAAPEPVPTEVV